MPSHYRSGKEWQREDHVFFSYSVRVLKVFFFYCMHNETALPL